MDAGDIVQIIAVCISSLVAIVSLCISIAAYKLKVPKLSIRIANEKTDCWFGIAYDEEHATSLRNHVSGAQFSLYNNSAIAITINNVYIKIKKEKYRLVDNSNSYWENMSFYYYDNNGEFTSDGSGIWYKESGIHVPYMIKPYDVFNGTALFYNFPVSIHHKVRATLAFETVIGTVKKRIHLYEYDKNFESVELKDVKQYQRSIEEGEK